MKINQHLLVSQKQLVNCCKHFAILFYYLLLYKSTFLLDLTRNLTIETSDDVFHNLMKETLLKILLPGMQYD